MFEIKKKRLPKGVVVLRTETGFQVDISDLKEIAELRLALGKLLQEQEKVKK